MRGLPVEMKQRDHTTGTIAMALMADRERIHTQEGMFPGATKESTIRVSSFLVLGIGDGLRGR